MEEMLKSVYEKGYLLAEKNFLLELAVRKGYLVDDFTYYESTIYKITGKGEKYLRRKK